MSSKERLLQGLVSIAERYPILLILTVQAGFTTNNPSGMGLGENYLLSNFGSLNYNFDRKYFISANLRQDEYSALGIKKGTFWGFSAGWEITPGKVLAKCRSRSHIKQTQTKG